MSSQLHMSLSPLLFQGLGTFKLDSVLTAGAGVLVKLGSIRRLYWMAWMEVNQHT
ncbi:hypothetical protein DPMN_125730 [Dreissena polymorpha]|uniref:Uncharacterized protein n=1 Tax=Dreissena polymorpha TaxID=45954 RepID=A0A9D4GYA5_DREPO|nr:hypothetical protein DPMN_125730 [Dreissena polymorpha]